MAQQRARCAALLVGQVAQCLLLRFIPFRRTSGMMPFLQAGQAVLVPALSPVLGTVQVHCKLACYLLQG
jgi:hypothetical protein